MNSSSLLTNPLPDKKKERTREAYLLVKWQSEKCMLYFIFFYAERVLYSKHLPFASIQGEKKIVSSLLINEEQNSVLGYNLR